MNFIQAIETCVRKWVHTDGRASRSEYWYFELFSWGVHVLSYMLISAPGAAKILLIPYAFATVFLIIANITVAIRRLHDIDRSGWWIFLDFLPIIGWFILFIWHCMRGTRGENRFGGDPLATK